ncbi:hypothetical protein [Kitasatospora sp. MBT66]|uniref:hypothetical protein n=1 Tax=Kitasatospora sp. MBT66 TaxID=1444769 RepID=UPI000AB0DECC|nr:hypothetical protein [Kitasatospora sp. MBT66]
MTTTDMTTSATAPSATAPSATTPGATAPSTATPGAANPTTERPVPVWALRTARALPLLALPVCLWRLPFGFGFQMGMDMPREDLPLWVTVPYVLTLSLLSEAFALLCAGLVRPWGERAPAWLVVAAGTVAGGAFTALTVQWVLTTFELAGFHEVGFVNGWWRALATVVSGLFVLWGPLILALTYAYHRRRRA